MLSYKNHDASTHTHSIPSEMIQIQYLSSIIRYIHHASTHPTISIRIKSNICSVPFKKLFYFPMSRKDRAYYYLVHNFTNTSMITKPAFYVTSSVMFTSNLYKTRLLDYKKLRVICYLMYTVLIPNIQHSMTQS